MVLGQLCRDLHCEQRCVSGMALFEWLVSCISGLFMSKEKLKRSSPGVNKPTMLLTSHAKDFLSARSCVGRKSCAHQVAVSKIVLMVTR